MIKRNHLPEELGGRSGPLCWVDFTEDCRVGSGLVMWSVVYARFLNVTSGSIFLVSYWVLDFLGMLCDDQSHQMAHRVSCLGS